MEENLYNLLQDLALGLTAKRLVLGTAESCTGGLVSTLCTARPGSSDWFCGGIVAYSNDIKQKLLGVPAEVLAKHGAVSLETAREMAVGALKALGADCAISLTGIAGPGGGNKSKPVGTVIIGLALPARLGSSWPPIMPEVLHIESSLADISDSASHRLLAAACLFQGDRSLIRRRTAFTALRLLRDCLGQN